MPKPTISQYMTLASKNAPTEGYSEFDPDFIATCYIAGPMTGYDNFNFHAFEAAENVLSTAGWYVFNPADQGHIEGKDLKWYMRKDLHWVASSDAVFFLPGWQDSKGAFLEFEVCRYLDIPCYNYETGGKIHVVASEGDEMLLGIDHEEIETAEGGPTTAPNTGAYVSGPEMPLERNSSAETAKRYGVCCGDPGDCGRGCEVEPQDEWSEAVIQETDPMLYDRGDKHPGYRTPNQQIEDAWAAQNAQMDGLHSVSVASELMKKEHDKFWPEVTRHPGSARFHALLEEAAALHDKKQADYGAAGDPFKNVRNSQDFGVDPWIGAMIRLNDKIKRLQSLVANGRLANESALDSFRDITVYSVIAQVLFEEQHGRGD